VKSYTDSDSGCTFEFCHKIAGISYTITTKVIMRTVVKTQIINSSIESESLADTRCKDAVLMKWVSFKIMFES